MRPVIFYFADDISARNDSLKRECETSVKLKDQKKREKEERQAPLSRELRDAAQPNIQLTNIHIFDDKKTRSEK